MICDPWTLVVVPFPFTDGPGAKRRPALVASPRDFNAQAGHSLLLMVTSAQHSAWPGDVPIDIPELKHPCVIRMKFFTLDTRFVLETIGELPARYRPKVRQFIDALLK